jgi:hypothetical protein
MFPQQQTLKNVVHYSDDPAMVIVKDNDAILATIIDREDIILLESCRV